MKIKKLLTVMTFVAALLLLPLSGSASTNYHEFPAMNSVDENKTFTVNFNTGLELSTVNNENIFVTDKEGNHLKNIVALTSDKKRVVVVPESPYSEGEYTLYVTDNVKSDKGVKANKGFKMDFTVTQDSGSPFIE